MHYRCVLGDIDIAVQVYPTKPHILDEEGLFAAARGIYHYDKSKPYSESFSRIFEALFDTADPLDPGPLALDVDAIPSEDIHASLTRAFSYPNVAGAFVWTGIDYWGEPTPRRFTVISSSYGTRDIMGIPKDYYWLLRSSFRSDPIVHGFPHWTWPGKEGDKTPFRVYSNCDEIEILMKGQPATDSPRLPVKVHMVEVDGVLSTRQVQYLCEVIAMAMWWLSTDKQPQALLLASAWYLIAVCLIRNCRGISVSFASPSLTLPAPFFLAAQQLSICLWTAQLA
jgi:hypothetical protein